jgi:hypothetical protein
MLVSDAALLRQMNWPSTDESAGQANQIGSKGHISAGFGDVMI